MAQVTRGYFKGTKLTAPKSGQTRPTSSKVKEAIMSLLIGELEGMQVIDLFAGSGSMGIEMLSSGARSCLFVERDREALGCLQSNLKLILERASKQALSIQAKVTKEDVESFLAKNNSKFDLVWLDPPYKLYEEFPAKIYSDIERMVAPLGLIVFESDKAGVSFIEQSVSGRFTLQKQKKYGDTFVSIYKEEL